MKKLLTILFAVVILSSGCFREKFEVCGDLVLHDGYAYSTVQIGDQCWFSENCRYLPEVSPSSEGSETSPYYYVYDYQGTKVRSAKATTNYENYGVLYNWPAMMTGCICPSGWHIPSDEEFTELTDAANGRSLKENGFASATLVIASFWTPPNTGATYGSGWTGLPGGLRLSDDFIQNGELIHSSGFDGKRDYGFWWSATEAGSSSWNRELRYNSASVFRDDTISLDAGFSARCVRD